MNHRDKVITSSIFAVAALLILAALYIEFRPTPSTETPQENSGSPYPISDTSASTTPPDSSQGTSGTIDHNQSQSTLSTATACTAADLTSSGGWQTANGSLSAHFLVTNQSATPCTLSGNIHIQILSGNKILGTSEENGISLQNLTLAPKAASSVHFTWSNWCGAGASVAKQIKLTLEDGTYLLVPVISTNGVPQSDTPSCSIQNASSEITVDAI